MHYSTKHCASTARVTGDIISHHHRCISVMEKWPPQTRLYGSATWRNCRRLTVRRREGRTLSLLIAVHTKVDSDNQSFGALLASSASQSNRSSITINASSRCFYNGSFQKKKKGNILLLNSPNRPFKTNKSEAAASFLMKSPSSLLTLGVQRERYSFIWEFQSGISVAVDSQSWGDLIPL